MNDSGEGSLRQAIIDANNNTGDDTILFDKTLQGTIHLSSGKLSITDSLIISGLGANKVTISGDHKNRVFSIAVEEQGTVLLEGLTISNGNGSDGNGGGGLLFIVEQSLLIIASSLIMLRLIMVAVEGLEILVRDLSPLRTVH